MSIAISGIKPHITGKRSESTPNSWRHLLRTADRKSAGSNFGTGSHAVPLAVGSFQLYLTPPCPCVCRATLLYSSDTGPCTAQAGLKVLGCCFLPTSASPAVAPPPCYWFEGIIIRIFVFFEIGFHATEDGPGLAEPSASHS